MSDLVLVTGAGGFIGGWLVRRLLDEGFKVRAVDLKPTSRWWQRWPEADNKCLDMTVLDLCKYCCNGAKYVYNLAADMGGIGFIESHKADCMTSVLINTHMLMAARRCEVERYFYSSSACVYAAGKQSSCGHVLLKESDAYPADPEDGYGWEKLFSERMCRHFTEDYGLATRVARLHNVYGPHGSWCDGREKAPAAICRKVAHAARSGLRQIGVWGTGKQTRSFMFVSDCVTGIRKLMDSDVTEPINLGTSEVVTIDHLVDVVCGAAGVSLERVYNPSAAVGVAGRGSDNTEILRRLEWEPSVKLTDGIVPTYEWVAHQVYKQ